MKLSCCFTAMSAGHIHLTLQDYERCLGFHDILTAFVSSYCNDEQVLNLQNIEIFVQSLRVCSMIKIADPWLNCAISKREPLCFPCIAPLLHRGNEVNMLRTVDSEGCHWQRYLPEVYSMALTGQQPVMIRAAALSYAGCAPLNRCPPAMEIDVLSLEGW